MQRTGYIAVVLVILCACTMSGTANVARTSSSAIASSTASPALLPATHSGWPLRTSRPFRVSLRVPPNWIIRWNPIRDGTLGDILNVGSWRFSPNLPECRHIPPGQALISLSAGIGGNEAGFGTRPRRFETTHLRRRQVREGCSQKAQLFRFTDAGRHLYAWMMFGSDLPTGVRTKAEAVLSTLRVEPPA